MGFDLNNKATTTKSNSTRSVIFVLIGVLACGTLFLLAFKRQKGEQGIPETNISTPSTVSGPVPLEEPEFKMAKAPSRAIDRESLPTQLTGINRYQPDSFVVDPEILKRKELAETEDNEVEKDEASRAEFAADAAIFRNLQLKDENGVIPLNGMEKAREQMKEMQAEQQRRAEAAGKPEGLSVAGLAPGDWAWQGPGNIGGRIRSIVISPADPTKIWVGSVGGGIWKSTNAGGSWSPVNDFLANLAVSTMVIDPTNSNIMYAGTGEGLTVGPPTGDALQGDGIFKSTDGGTTWNQLASTKISDPLVCPAAAPCPWKYVNRLAISPDGTTILAATGSAIRRSADGGATWTMVTPNATRSYSDIDFHPLDSQIAVAGSDGLTVFTTDGGQNWTTAGYPTPGTSVPGRSELAYAPSSPNIVYASIDQNKGELYRSTDGGQTFIQVNTGVNFLGKQGYYANIIWVNPQDPTFVIVGGLDLWRSTNSGQNLTQISDWTMAPNSSAHADHHMIVASTAFNNGTNKIVYFGNDGGIYRANNVSTVAQTSGWTNMNSSLGITQFYGAAGNSAGVIVGGAQDNGNLRSSTNPNAWTTMIGGDGGNVAADQTDPNYFYGEYVYLTLRRSINGGGSASDMYCNPLPANSGPCVGAGITEANIAVNPELYANFIAPLFLDPNEPNRLLATARDSANNWVEYTGVTQFSPWAISGLAPTAAGVSVSGRVTTAEGRGINSARVSLTDQSGNVRTALTNSFGYYRFDAVDAGQTVVLSVTSKRYIFGDSTRVLSVQDELADIDFTAEP